MVADFETNDDAIAALSEQQSALDMAHAVEAEELFIEAA
jgi:hypothetical protein